MFVKPLAGNHRGMTLYTPGNTSGGVRLNEALQFIESNFDLDQPFGPHTYVTYARALNQSFCNHKHGQSRSYTGNVDLKKFLRHSDILICMLPLTPVTRGILNTQLFSQLRNGNKLINVARSQHLVEADLLTALKSGHVGAAPLDVFNQKPLPDKHLFWDLPNILITPH